MGERTWREADGVWLVVPVGSFEQHGPHLPLDTDSRIAGAVAHRVVAALRRSGVDAAVGPLVAVTASGEHDGFAGTLSVGVDVTRDLVVELVRSADWAAGVVIVNAHGGNTGALGAAVALSQREGRRVVWPRYRVAGDAHAGRSETSIMLAIAPELVRLDRLEVGETAPWSTIGPAVVRDGVRAVSPNGVLGDPRGATAAEGVRLLDGIVAEILADVVAEISG